MIVPKGGGHEGRTGLEIKIRDPKIHEKKGYGEKEREREMVDSHNREEVKRARKDFPVLIAGCYSCHSPSRHELRLPQTRRG